MTNEATDLSAVREFYRNRRIGARVGFGDSLAVAVIDMSRAFTSDDYGVGTRDDDLIISISQLLNAARAAHCPVVYTTISYERPDQAGYWGAKIPALLELKADDANAAQVHPDIAPAPDDLVVNKHYSSAFFGTDLNSYLTRSRVDTLIIAGCSTSGCVRATVVDAVSTGYRVIVPRQAVGDRAQLPHEATLFDIDSKYGDVMELHDVIDHLHKLASQRGDNDRID